MKELLHYEVIKSPFHSEWVVFIHGAGGSSKTWNRQVRAFSEYYNILLLDLRDHGESKNILPTSGQYSFELISSDFIKVLDHLGIHRAHFLTLSFGSVLIQDFMRRYPERVHKVIFVGAVFKATWSVKAFVHFARFLNLFLSYEHMYKLFSFLLMPKKRNEVARRTYQMEARKIKQEEYLKWLALYDAFFQLLRNFQNHIIENDLLIVMGADDFIFLESARNFSRKQPKSQLQVLEGVGHICNLEAPVRFNELGLNFLRNTKVVNGRA